MSHSLIKKRPAKKDKKINFEKNLIWVTVAAERVQGGLAHGRKGADDKWRGESFPELFFTTLTKCFVLWEQDHQD